MVNVIYVNFTSLWIYIQNTSISQVNSSVYYKASRSAADLLQHVLQFMN